MTIEDIDSLNAVHEEDLTKVSVALFEFLLIKKGTMNRLEIDRTEGMVDATTEFLRKMLFHDTELTNGLKLNILNLLDTLKTQKESLELIKTNASIADIQQAAQRLSKKTQSAFRLK